MKKVIALLAVSAFALAIVACGKKADEATTGADTTQVEAPVAADTTAVIDTAAAAADTAK